METVREEILFCYGSGRGGKLDWSSRVRCHVKCASFVGKVWRIGLDGSEGDTKEAKLLWSECLTLLLLVSRDYDLESVASIVRIPASIGLADDGAEIRGSALVALWTNISRSDFPISKGMCAKN